MICTTGFAVLGLDAPTGVWIVGSLAVSNALLGMALGRDVSGAAVAALALGALTSRRRTA